MSTRQPKPHRRVTVDEKSRAYRQLWRVVDGAVFDALYTHSDYLTDKGRRSARMSINKRVVGAVLGFAEQSAKGRSGAMPAADRVSPPRRVISRTVQLAVSKWRMVWERIIRRLSRTPA